MNMLSRNPTYLCDRRCIAIVALIFWSATANAQPGTALWTNRYNGPISPATPFEYAPAIVADKNGDAVVTGYSVGAGIGIRNPAARGSSSWFQNAKLSKADFSALNRSPEPSVERLDPVVVIPDCEHAVCANRKYNVVI